MQGPPATEGAAVAEKDVGLISRSMEHVFAGIAALKAEGWQHEVAVKVWPL